MKFDAWLYRQKKNNDHIRLSYQIMIGSHDFPQNSSRNSLAIFCKKHSFDETVKSALNKSFDDFIQLPYATFTCRGERTIAKTMRTI